MSSAQKDLRALLDQAEQQGFTVTKQRRHYRITCPSGQPIFSSFTPSDWRSLRNLRSQLRREGFRA